MAKTIIDVSGPGSFEQVDLFSAQGRAHFRIPSIAVTGAGNILAFANRRINTSADEAEEVHLVMRRSSNGGREWQPISDMFAEPDWHAAIGTAIADTNNGTVVLPYHRGQRNKSDKSRNLPKNIKSGDYLAVSNDDGLTWIHDKITVKANRTGWCGSTHGASPGITLQHGRKKGRLLAPARFANQPDEELSTLQKHHYNCTIYSDDHGKTWHTGEPVQVGTGEGCLVELSDGRIYYNSRAYFLDGKRRTAWSYDGGQTFTDFAIDEELTEPINGGCNASMALYPREMSDGKDIVLFGNPADDKREKFTVRLSKDGGITWSASKVIHDGPAAYSSMAISQKGDILVLYENGDEHPYERISIARFNLEWLANN